VSPKPAFPQSTWMLLLQCALAVVLPLAGVIIAVMLLASGRPRDAGMVAASTVLGAVLYGALLL
jgi:hypothetical protein